MNEPTDSQHTYPHQTHDEVTPAMLQQDMADNPHAYPEALRPHVDRHLRSELGERAVTTPEAEPINAPTRTIRDIELILTGEKEGNLTADDTLMYITHDPRGQVFAIGNLMYKLDRFPIDIRVIRCMIDNDKVYEIINKVGKFIDIDEMAIADELIGTGNAKILAGGLFRFKETNLNSLVRKLDQVGEGKEAISRLGAHRDKARTLESSLFYELLETDYASQVLPRAIALFDIDQRELIEKLALENRRDLLVAFMKDATRIENLDIGIARKMIEWQEGAVLARNMKSFNLDQHRMELASMLLDNGYGAQLHFYLPSLGEVDEDLARKFIDAGHIEWLAGNFNMLKNPSWNTVSEILENCERWYNNIAMSLGRASGLSEEYRDQVIIWLYEKAGLKTLASLTEEMLTDTIRRHPEVFAATKGHLQELMDQQLINNDMMLSMYVKIVQTSGEELPKVFRYQDELFGEYGSYETFGVIHDLMERAIVPDAVAQLGVDKVGSEGIGQLREKLADLMRTLSTIEIKPETEELLEHSVMARAVFMRMTEYDTEGGYGNHTEDSLHRKLQYLREAREDGRVSQLAEGYTPSRVYEIATSSSKKEKPEWTEDILKRYGDLLFDIREAAVLSRAYNRESGEIQPFKLLLDDLREGVRYVIEGIDAEYQAVEDDDPKAAVKRQSIQKKRDGLQKYIDEIETGDGQKRFIMNSPAAFAKAFEELEKYPQLHSPMRQLVFAWAMRKHPDQRELTTDMGDDPRIEDIAAMREFIDHIVNQETYGQYFTTTKLANKFKKMTGAGRFEEALQRASKNAEYTQTTALRFVPSRGILMEMSGQIGNACWADRNESIAEDMPNMTAVIMQARPGQDNERVIGSALLIETTEKHTNDPVLLLRGTNPRENYINKVDPGEFYNALTDYVREIARQRGMKPAIVIDDHVGGSATNRPVLFGYMRAQQRDMQPVRVDYEDTYFNGYDVTRDSYAL